MSMSQMPVPTQAPPQILAPISRSTYETSDVYNPPSIFSGLQTMQ